MGPFVMAALYWRQATTAGVAAGVVAGWSAAAFFYVTPELKPFGIHEGVLGLLVHVPVLVGVDLATEAQDQEHTHRFCGDVETAP